MYIEKIRNRIPFLEKRWFTFLLGAVVWLNPVAILPQLWDALTIAQDRVGGISVATWCVFMLIQASVSLTALSTRNRALFESMLVSFVLSTLVVVTVLVRTA